MVRKFHQRVLAWCANKGFFNFLSDKQYLELVYYARVGHILHLDNPRMFTEKIQWLKLYDRKPEYSLMVDKYEAKKYVAKKIGKEYIIPTLGVWDKFDDIDFDFLPEQFVLKCTHDSGGLVICRDKKFLDVNLAKKKIEKSLRRNYYKHSREWPYRNVKPRIIAETYMTNGLDCDLVDYKMHCFNGNPMYCQVIQGRTTHQTIDFYDMEWNRMDFTGLHSPDHPYPHGEYLSEPSKFILMKNLARCLSKELKYSRIDFYLVNDNVFFGEITFYPVGGFGCFEPQEWDVQLGNMIQIPE